MKTEIYTWGTGGAFGREMGCKFKRQKRNHVSTSVIHENYDSITHFIIDAGSPCVESIVDNNITALPDILFMTHSHSDHISDFDKLINNIKRGLKHKRKDYIPFRVICTKECLEDPSHGLRIKFGYLEDDINYIIIPSFDVWYTISIEPKNFGCLIPSYMITYKHEICPIEFKALPVFHAVHAPGSCLYIFRIRGSQKKILISGDFESIEDYVIENPDLKDPDLLLLETNTLFATKTNHTNWIQNKLLIKRWVSGSKNVKVVLNHISGYEDYEQGFFKNVPTDKDWEKEIKKFKVPVNTKLEIAKDGGCYLL